MHNKSVNLMPETLYPKPLKLLAQGLQPIRYEALKGLELSQSKDDNHAKFNLLTNHVFLLASIVSLNKVSFSGKL